MKWMCFAAAALTPLLLAGGARAADSQNLNVTATVLAVCKFSSAVQTLSFGNLDPSAGTDAAGSGAAVSYRCTNRQPATGVSAGNGNNFSAGSRRMSNGTDFIPYTLTIGGDTQAGSGFGSGNDKALAVSGTVTGAAYANAGAGAYSDVVVLTISP